MSPGMPERRARPRVGSGCLRAYATPPSVYTTPPAATSDIAVAPKSARISLEKRTAIHPRPMFDDVLSHLGARVHRTRTLKPAAATAHTALRRSVRDQGSLS